MTARIRITNEIVSRMTLMSLPMALTLVSSIPTGSDVAGGAVPGAGATAATAATDVTLAGVISVASNGNIRRSVVFELQFANFSFSISSLNFCLMESTPDKEPIP